MLHYFLKPIKAGKMRSVGFRRP